MKKLILLFILCLFSFNASSQEWVNSLREYYKAKDYEGGIRLLERQQKTPYVYRHLSNLYSLQLEYMHGSVKLTEEGDILKSKYITSILQGGLQGDVCNKVRIFDQYVQSYNFDIEDIGYKYEYIDSLKKMFPIINTFEYNNNLLAILRNFQAIFFNDLTNDNKYREKILTNYFDIWQNRYCEQVPDLKKLNCKDKTERFTAEAAKLGNAQALNSLWSLEIDPYDDGIKLSDNYYNKLTPEQILKKLVYAKDRTGAGNLAFRYLLGDHGVMKNYIKAHAYKLISLQDKTGRGMFSGDYAKKALAKFDEIKIPIEAEIEAQKLAEKIMFEIQNQPATQYDYPLNEICQHWEGNKIMTPFKKE